MVGQQTRTILHQWRFINKGFNRRLNAQLSVSLLPSCGTLKWPAKMADCSNTAVMSSTQRSPCRGPVRCQPAPRVATLAAGVGHVHGAIPRLFRLGAGNIHGMSMLAAHSRCMVLSPQLQRKGKASPARGGRCETVSVQFMHITYSTYSKEACAHGNARARPIPAPWWF